MKNYIKKIKNYLRNCLRFRKELTEFKDFDYSYNLKLFKKSLEFTRNFLRDRGHEVEEDRLPKIYTMNRIIYLLECFENDVFMELAENQLGYEYTYHFHFEERPDGNYEFISDNNKRQEDKNNALLRLSVEIEDKMWKELWKLLENNLRKFWD